MVAKVVATPCLQWSQPSVPHSPTPNTAITSKKRALNDVALACRSAWLGTTSSKLTRSRSFEFNPSLHKSSTSIRRACSASFDTFSDEEFSRKIQELADKITEFHEPPPSPPTNFTPSSSSSSTMESEVSIEMKANSVDLPFSLRIIKQKIKKNQWQDEFIEAGESAYCSVKKAFSSMVFIIRELHSFTLQMRELLFYEDLKGILERVQGEMHASFVWLFQQVFSHTPTLMVYVMILLANFTVHSMSANALAQHIPPPSITATVEDSTKLDSSVIKSFSLSNGGKTASIGGGSGGGGKARPVASGTEGDGWVHRPVIHDGVSPATREEESVSGRDEVEEEGLWKLMVEEASRMQGEVRDEALDHEMLQQFVSPVTARIEGDEDYEEFFKTELHYQTGLAQEPSNVLLLANYAQFLYIVAKDYDRAEEYFKRAVKVEPKDAEAHNKYANFLWQVRNDLWAAEETFLEAISADPTNSFYAANYAHFLWNTGGEDTCFPLDDETRDE